MNSCILAHAAILMRHSQHLKQAAIGDMGLGNKSGLDAAPEGSRYTGAKPGQGGVGKGGFSHDMARIGGWASDMWDNHVGKINSGRVKRGEKPLAGNYGQAPLLPKARPAITAPPTSKSSPAAPTTATAVTPAPSGSTTGPPKASTFAVTPATPGSTIVPKVPTTSPTQVEAPAPTVTLAPKDAPAAPASPPVPDATPAVPEPVAPAPIAPITPNVPEPAVAPSAPATPPASLPSVSTTQPAAPALADTATPKPVAPAVAPPAAPAAPAAKKRTEFGPTPAGMELIGMGPGGVPKYAPIETSPTTSPSPAVRPLQPVTRQSRQTRAQAEAAAHLAKTRANIAAQQAELRKPMEANPAGLKLGPKKIPLDQLVAQNKANGIGSL